MHVQFVENRMENGRNIIILIAFGFVEVGRIPKTNKYDDGTYAADIHMIKSLT